MNIEQKLETISDRIKAVMKHKGLKQQQLAIIVRANNRSISQAAISDLIRNRTKNSKYIVEIAQALNVDSMWLKTGFGIAPRENIGAHKQEKNFGEMLDIEIKKAGFNYANFARQCGWKAGNQSARISQYISGARFPGMQTIEIMAKVLKISADELLSKCDDYPKSRLIIVEKKSENQNLIPRLNWSNVPIPPYLKILTEAEGIDAMKGVDGNCYALTIKDDSMISEKTNTSSFLIGSIIIVNPVKTPKHGSFVIIKHKNSNKPVLKQYIEHGDDTLLISLNEKYPTLVYDEKEIDICGVVIKKIEDFE